LPRAVIAQHQRRRLLTAAAEVFADRGYTATTVEDLVAAAEIGVGSFYSLCSGKEECLLALYDEAIEQARQVIEEALSAAGETAWAEQVCIGLREILGLVAERPLDARIAIVEIQTAGADAFQRYGETLDAVAIFLALGREVAGAAKPLPQSLEQTTVSGVAWLLHRYLSLDKAQSAPDLFEDLAALILEPYLGEDEARRAIARLSPAPAD